MNVTGICFYDFLLGYTGIYWDIMEPEDIWNCLEKSGKMEKNPYLAMEMYHNYIRKSVFRISEKDIVFSQNHYSSQVLALGLSLGKSLKIKLVGMMFSPQYDILQGILRFDP